MIVFLKSRSIKSKIWRYWLTLWC